MKHLIVTGDDFGINHKVNEEIESLHQAGLLTHASLMVNGEALGEAVRIARRNPRLTVGLHLALCDSAASRLSAITDSAGNLPPTPARAGLRYAFDRGVRPALAAEVGFQFERFLALGLPPAYWDGHTHLHLHPTVLRLSLPHASKGRFPFTRLVREPRPRSILPLVFHALSRAALPKLQALNIGHADRVYGLSQTGSMNMARFSRILAALEEGLSEVYFHPGVDGADLNIPRLLEQIGQTGAILCSRKEPRAEFSG